MWSWDEEHESAHLTVPFASVREAKWAEQAIPGWRVSSVYVGTTGNTRMFHIGVDLESPDSYTPEAEERDRDFERYQARTQAALAEAITQLDEEVGRLGVTPGDAAVLEAGVEARIAATRRDHFRAMPPTPHRVREAVTVVGVEGGEYLLDRSRRVSASSIVARSRLATSAPLLVGESYWMHDGVIQLAEVDDASLAALEDAPRVVDLHAFLARELQYGPLDVPRAREILLRAWLEANDALCLDAGELAVANSQRLITRRRPTTWKPWSGDDRILVRAG